MRRRLQFSHAHTLTHSHTNCARARWVRSVLSQCASECQNASAIDWVLFWLEWLATRHRWNGISGVFSSKLFPIGSSAVRAASRRVLTRAYTHAYTRETFSYVYVVSRSRRCRVRLQFIDLDRRGRRTHTTTTDGVGRDTRHTFVFAVKPHLAGI